jgi:outer membrane protein OmpA-like peptidoglycan-associated protein
MPPPALDPVPPLPPAAPTATPDATSPAHLGASDQPKLSAEQMAALEAARSPPAAVPVPAPAQAPQQQATLQPTPQAAPRSPEPDLTTAPTPQRTGRGGTVSLQAAEINFANGMTLTAEDDRRLAGVVKLYDKHGGIVRVVGYGRRGFGADAAQQELASFSKAIERANVVARALAQLGLASNRIVVQAAPVGDGLGEDRAEVLIEF